MAKVDEQLKLNAKDLAGKLYFKLLQAEESRKRLSHKLLQAFDFQSSALEDKFICLGCKGVPINPLFCSFCGYAYCEDCILSISDEMIHCHCETPTKGNFKAQNNHELYKTCYFVTNHSDANMMKRISYSEAVEAKNNSAYTFFKFLDLGENPMEYTSSKYVKYNLKIMGKNTKHQNKFDHKFILKSAKMVNFKFAKGYRLHLKEKKFLQNMGQLLRILHLKEVDLNDCFIGLEFTLPFSKGIDFNRKRLHSFKLTFKELQGSPFEKSYRLILNALLFCSNLENIEVDYYPCNEEESLSFPKSYSIFVSHWVFLKAISLSFFIFHDDLKYEYFKSLISLEELCIKNCKFQKNSFLQLYGNNFPKLNKLILEGNNIIDSHLNTCDDLIPNLDSQIKVPPMLEINVIKKCLESYILSTLIKSSTTILKSFSLTSYSGTISSEEFKGLIKVFELSQILSLELMGNCANAIVGYQEFCAFLRKSVHLKIFKLGVDNETEYNLCFESLKSNQSIQILSLKGKELSRISTDIQNMIRSNSSISTLVIEDFDFIIEEGFIKTVLESKSLQYLFINLSSKQKDETLLKLLESNLKGIYIYKKAISKETMGLIHSKIPRVEFSKKLQYYEKYLK